MNEIRVTAGLSVNKNGANVAPLFSHVFTLTGDQSFNGVQVIGTSTEQIVFPADLIAEGISYVLLKNLDATNYIELSTDNATSNKFAKLLPGGIAVYPIYDQSPAGSPAVYAKAHTGACKLFVAVSGIT